MDFEWVGVALGDVIWISLAFALGLLSKLMGLPPLVGFLAAGFVLNAQGVGSNDLLQKLSDLGITLLLFTVGLKLNLRTLVRPQVWAVTGIHMSVVVGLFGLAIYGLALAGASVVADLDLQTSLLVAFALSFSSTVFVVKVLDESGEMASLHGRIAIGILIMQDVAAVVFIAASTGSVPSLWALVLLLLIPLRPVLYMLLQRAGHGELLVLLGFVLALGGAELFELVEMKGDLGALVLGVLVANHAKADELAKTMLGFKDLFLLSFFLSIGLAGELSLETLVVGAILTPLIFLKSALFFALLIRFNLRARTSLLTSLSLTNYSEFGLIVAAIGVANGWIDGKWLIIISIALSLSFVVAAALNVFSHHLYTRYRRVWKRMQREQRLPDDTLLDIGGATVAIIGMGAVGTGAYDMLLKRKGESIVGVDIDADTVRHQRATGRNVLLGDPSDADFWDRMQTSHKLDLVLLALPKQTTNLAVLNQLAESSFDVKVAATAKFPDQVEALKEAGATMVFNMYAEAGAGFATYVTAAEQT